jgi:hypothetical protein
MSARTDEEAEQNQASSGITPDSLGHTLREKLGAEHVDIQDLSGRVNIGSAKQENLLSRVCRWMWSNV